MISWTDVTDIAPELSTVASGTQTAILAQVLLQMNEDEWGDLYETGQVYLAAHLATLGRRKGVGGFVASESAGSVSRSYSNSVAQGAAALGSTSYGAEYERLIGLLPTVWGCTTP